jgi:D-alanine-D-alanine ligase
MNKNILLLYGGKEEASISCISAKYVNEKLLQIPGLNIYLCSLNEMNKVYFNQSFKLNKEVYDDKNAITFTINGIFVNKVFKKIHYCIPCIHGAPGENGELQTLLEYYNIKYLGNNSDLSKICFNKISTKLWAEKLKVPTTPYEVISPADGIKATTQKFKSLGGKVFVKASSQGSSIGCYPANSLEIYNKAVKDALEYGTHVLVEKSIIAREIEIAAFEYDGKLIISNPGEVLNGQEFYSFDDKYSKSSKAQTTTSPVISDEAKEKMMMYARKIFISLGLRDLSRIDFFLDDDEQIYLNEINTFPGLTPISLFPQLLEDERVTFTQYLKDRITK